MRIPMGAGNDAIDIQPTVSGYGLWFEGLYIDTGAGQDYVWLQRLTLNGDDTRLVFRTGSEMSGNAVIVKEPPAQSPQSV